MFAASLTPYFFLRRTVAALAVGSCVCALPSAWAQAALPSAAQPGVYVQAASAEHNTDTLTIGYTLPWKDWHSSLFGADVRGYWDFALSRWSADGTDGRFHTTVLGVTPSFRIVPDAGRSHLFFDAGVGATLASQRYVTAYKEFSTSFNFATHVGVGVAFGEQRQHELQLRIEHVSNASIRKPNPGENFVQLRYAFHF